MTESDMEAHSYPVTLHWVRIDDGTPATWNRLRELLDAGETRRADRLRVDAARRLFIAGRALARTVLGSTLGCAPASLQLVISDLGKPRLARPPGGQDLHFNIAHSGAVVVLATTTGIELGADVESRRTKRPHLQLARRFFTPVEADAVAHAEGADRQRVFLHLWTAKEAVLKATGSGLRMPVREVEVDPDPDEGPRVLNLGGDTDAAAAWTLLRQEVPGEWLATVAYRGPRRPFEIREVGLGEMAARTT
jgi:4'-phosphopantetheinyl transferase